MKKNFKSKIVAGLLAATTAVSVSAPVFARDVYDLYSKFYMDDNSIDIVYNGEVLTYTDAQPQLINDRTMIPFRAVLETMGATVNYDDATRMVTATRGNTTIQFSLDGNVIDVDKNGEKSQITMDVPMTVVNDRTLVPIRFMSNALGMNVGWDSDLKTVVILDSEAYMNELKTLSNFGKLMDMEQKMPAVENGSFAISLDFASVDESESMAFDVNVDTDYEIKNADGVIGGNVAVNLDIDGLNDVIKKISEENVELKNIENATIEVVADEGVVYFKTDLIEKLAAAYPAQEDLQSIAKFADKNTWFKWDMAETFNKLAEEDASMKAMADLVNGGISGLNNMKGEDAFEMIVSRNGDVALSDVMTIDSMVDTYAAMDKFITINVEENGDYAIAINITEDDFISMMKSVAGYEPDAETVQQIKDVLDINIKVEGVLKDGKVTSALDYTIGVDYSEEGTSVKCTLKMTAESEGDMNATAEPAKVPAAALDIMDIAEALEN